MRNSRVSLLTTATACVAAIVVCAGRQAPSIRITSPTDGTYLMGAVRFTVAFDPAAIVNQVQNIRWFADGRQVCTVSIPPYSCEWDAGGMVNEHLIRAVATLRNGERLVANSRTAAVEYAEAAKRASAITPVPGGVGPMTIATLLANTLLAAQWQARR